MRIRLLVTVVCLVCGPVLAQDSLNCREVGYYDTPGSAYGVAVSGGYAYVADDSAGLRIIEFYGGGVEEKEIIQNKEPVSTVVCQVLKVPGEDQPAELFDITGKKVLKLKPGLNDVRGIKPGVYFIKGEKTTKVLITR